jgi:hypothetical protein
VTVLRADDRLADVPMTTVECSRCTAEVLARKSSGNQTSVQWDASALRRCAERREAERLTGTEGHRLFLACSALDGAIADAVRRGKLPLVDDVLPAMG